MRTRDIGTEAWRLPTAQPGETVIFAEPGRVLDLKRNGGNYDVCYRSHAFHVVEEGGMVTLRVRHGGGQESLRIGWANDPLIEALGQLDSDARYFVLYAIMATRRDAINKGRDEAKASYVEAFAQGRLKKRKVRGADRVKVWIESPAGSLRHD